MTPEDAKARLRARRERWAAHDRAGRHASASPEQAPGRADRAPRWSLAPVHAPKIDVRVPFEPGAALGEDYNRIMGESAHEWVALLDHDVLLLNPSWYALCQEAIRRTPDAGLFTCVTNNVGQRWQRSVAAPATDDLGAHRRHARRLFDAYGFQATPNDRFPISGFFMLLCKTAWRAAGGFPEGALFGVDQEFWRRCIAAGVKTYRLDGLYCYHIRDRSGEGPWIAGIETATTLAAQRSHGAPTPAPDAPAPEAPARRCIYTVVTGDYDALRPAPRAPGWAAIAFVDAAFSAPANGWELRRFDGGADPVRAARRPKILAHEFLPDFDYSLYVDGNREVVADPTPLCARLDWPEFALPDHPERSGVYAELAEIARLKRAPATACRADAARYRAEGVPPGAGLFACNFILRRHHSCGCQEIAAAWWMEYAASPTRRDQPALAVALWRLDRAVTFISTQDRDAVALCHGHGQRA